MPLPFFIGIDLRQIADIRLNDPMTVPAGIRNRPVAAVPAASDDIDQIAEGRRIRHLDNVFSVTGIIVHAFTKAACLLGNSPAIISPSSEKTASTLKHLQNHIVELLMIILIGLIQNKYSIKTGRMVGIAGKFLRFGQGGRNCGRAWGRREKKPGDFSPG